MSKHTLIWDNALGYLNNLEGRFIYSLLDSKLTHLLNGKTLQIYDCEATKYNAQRHFDKHYSTGVYVENPVIEPRNYFLDYEDEDRECINRYNSIKEG